MNPRFLMLLYGVLPWSPVDPLPPCGPIPSTQQVVWQKMEYYAFIHFNMNTFTGKEWGDGTEDPALFAPSDLDCRQWARICRQAGMKGIILTAKHHDGFCLWPSHYTEHSVRHSPFRGGKGDLVLELAQACKEYGLRLGVYVSPWDRHEPSYGDSPRYNEHFKNQLRELLTAYGEIFEVWFDGACGEGPNGKRQVYDWRGFVEVVRTYQPNALIFSDGGPDIRWVGNENGEGGDTNWSFLRGDEVYPGYPRYQELTAGHADGTRWIPAECDVSIRPGWYYTSQQDGAVKTLRQLVDIYFASVGRNANLLLNIPVDRRGLIHEQDAERLGELRRYLDRAFSNDLLHGKEVVASEVRGNDLRFSARNVTDGLFETYWSARDSSRSASIEIRFADPTQINCLLLQEYIPLGQRVQEFSVDISEGNSWAEAARGTTIGYKRLLRFPCRAATGVRINILASRSCPVLSTLSAFRIPDIVEGRE
jgi:alpha-L-fucosidase